MRLIHKIYLVDKYYTSSSIVIKQYYCSQLIPFKRPCKLRNIKISPNENPQPNFGTVLIQELHNMCLESIFVTHISIFQ